MTTTEEKLNAVLRFIAAESTCQQEKARHQIRKMLGISTPPSEESVEDITRRILLEIGVPESLKGYERLVTAVCAASDNPDLLNAITKELYPMDAMKHLDTKSKVERSIRHCIEVAWDRCDYAVLQHYFGNTVAPNKGRPTNGEFIALVADRLSLEKDR